MIAVDPFFTNDAAGYARIVFTYIMATTPIFGIVVFFLRRGPDQAIAQMKTDLNALGAKVTEQGSDASGTRIEIATLHRENAENQRELVAMLTESGRAIQAEISEANVKLARLEERSDIADCFEKFGTRIENAVMRMASQRSS